VHASREAPVNVVLPLLLALGLSCSAHADESQAETCLRTKVWEGYSDGWAIRTMTTTTLQPGATRSYLVTFYPGKEYLIRGCGDDASKDVDLVLYDLQGKVVLRDQAMDREPSLTWKTDKVATYYVVVHAKELAAGQTSSGVAVAVTYR
jgi:hypothetical protein